MGWITLVAVWYLGTVLRERREQFVFGALMAGRQGVVRAVDDHGRADALMAPDCRLSSDGRAR